MRFTDERRGKMHFTGAFLLSLLLLGASLVAVDVFGAETAPRLKNMVDSGPRQPQKPEKPAPPKIIGPADDYDRGVPRTSVMGFLDAAGKGDYERAAQYLDLRYLPWRMQDMTGAELARQLKIVLDRTIWIDPELLSDDPQGHTNDGLPASRDLLGQIQTGGKQYTLLLQRVPREDGVLIWKISNATVVDIPELYAQVGYGRLGEYLSRKLPDIEIMGAMLWQWVGLFALMILSFALVFSTTWFVSFLLKRRKTNGAIQAAGFIRGPLCLLLWVLLFRSQIGLVSPTVAMTAVLRAETLLLVGVAWSVVRLADYFIDYQAAKMTRNGRFGAVVAFRGPLRIIVRLAAATAAVLFWLLNLGFSITAILAGLGVGGVALALAAQRTFEDVLGAAVLYFSQPVRVGDFGRFGDTVGTVEEIGLRGTRIRTLEHSVLTISNSNLSRMPIENFTARAKIWYHPRLSLSYDTPTDSVKLIIDRIQMFLNAHEQVEGGSARIRFTEIGLSALYLDVFAYVKITDYDRYLEVAEELNIAILKIMEEAGVRLSPPSQQIYIRREQIPGYERQEVNSCPGEPAACSGRLP